MCFYFYLLALRYLCVLCIQQHKQKLWTYLVSVRLLFVYIAVFIYLDDFYENIKIETSILFVMLCKLCLLSFHFSYM